MSRRTPFTSLDRRRMAPPLCIAIRDADGRLRFYDPDTKTDGQSGKAGTGPRLMDVRKGNTVAISGQSGVVAS
jgi:hypothetical protein